MNRRIAHRKIGFVLGCVVAIAAARVFCLGCSSKTNTPVHVAGQASLDRKPLHSGTIRIVPDHGRAATGSIANDGRFTLARYKPDDGCLPGEYHVEVIPVNIEGVKSSPSIPAKYTNMATSGLTITIDGPTDALKVELTSMDSNK